MPSPTHGPKLWLHHLADEADAAFLYRELAAGEADPKRSALYTRLAEVENRHVGVWQKLLTEHGHAVPAVRVSAKARMMAWLARRFGPQWLLPMLLEEEGQEVKGYLQLYKSAPDGRRPVPPPSGWPANPRSTPTRSRRLPGRSANRGTRPRRAASSGTWCTDSTTG